MRLTQRLANRFDLSLPENQRKLDAAEQLSQLADEAGLTLIQLAIAFVLRHPAITAPIKRPRTMDHLESQLAAADVVLSTTSSLAEPSISSWQGLTDLFRPLWEAAGQPQLSEDERAWMRAVDTAQLPAPLPYADDNM